MLQFSFSATLGERELCPDKCDLPSFGLVPTHPNKSRDISFYFHYVKIQKKLLKFGRQCVTFLHDQSFLLEVNEPFHLWQSCRVHPAYDCYI